jgi:uncharacterized protein YlzI (FlbEa/FlbD family)
MIKILVFVFLNNNCKEKISIEPKCASTENLSGEKYQKKEKGSKVLQKIRSLLSFSITFDKK